LLLLLLEKNLAFNSAKGFILITHKATKHTQ